MTDARLSEKPGPDDAWQRLVGTWCHTVKATNSTSELRLQFTPDRKLVRSSSLHGGVLPIPMTNQATTDILGFELQDDVVLLTLGSTPFGRPGGTLALRFRGPDQIALEEGPVYAREA